MEVTFKNVDNELLKTLFPTNVNKKIRYRSIISVKEHNEYITLQLS